MGFFKKFKSKILPAIGAIIGGSIGGPPGAAIGAGIGSGASTYSTTHDFGDAFKSAAISAGTTYAGSSIGNALLPKTIGESAFNTLPGGSISNFAQNMIPGEVANASIGSLLGGYAGNSIGDSVKESMFPSAVKIGNAGPTGPTPFSPKQDEEMAQPASLSGLGSLTDTQRSSNLATQGVYGGGNGPEEQKYFMNLLNRRLVDKSGKTGDLSQINPIEQSYLQRLGLSGFGNTSNLLEAMSKWSPA